MDRHLLDDAALGCSSVVANCAMNRERQLAGCNSYAKELGFNPIDWLSERLARVDAGSGVGWLDLCCGTGRALRQAAQRLCDNGLADRAELIGVDLVDHFDPAPAAPGPLRLICSPITSWVAERCFDLITCVHGLHYVGDKLGVLARASGWLTEDGLFVADLDLGSVRASDGRPAGRRLAGHLHAAGFVYDPRRRRITRAGRREVSPPYEYLGADDRSGPNYTGQPAVHSYYRHL